MGAQYMVAFGLFKSLMSKNECAFFTHVCFRGMSAFRYLTIESRAFVGFSKRPEGVGRDVSRG